MDNIEAEAVARFEKALSEYHAQTQPMEKKGWTSFAVTPVLVLTLVLFVGFVATMAMNNL